MAGGFTSGNKTIGELLGQYEKRHVEIPPFQRGFSWEKAQIAIFWDDLLSLFHAFRQNRSSASYFLGPIVTQPRESKVIVLDGQQRLATATILLAAIRDLARTKNDGKKKFNGGNDLARDIQVQLIQKSGSPPSFSLSLGELDENYFHDSIKSDPPRNTKPRLRSHRLIQATYNYFHDEIKKLLADKDNESCVTVLQELRDCLTTSMGRRDISRFLRHMWLSKHGDLKARGLYGEIKEHLEKNKVASVSFAEECADECDTYISIVDLSDKIPAQAKIDLGGIVRYLNITAALPLLLSARQCLNDSDFAKLSKFISGLSVRYLIIMNFNPSDFESRLYEAAREIRGKKSTAEKSRRCLQAAQAILAPLNPSDTAVIEACNDIDLNRNQAIWILTKIANMHQSKTKEIGIDNANLEHIFPLNPSANWLNRTALEPFAWHLGNLTVLGNALNNKAKNDPFSEKRKTYKKSEVVLTKQILKWKNWTENEIKERGIELGFQLCKLWP